MEDTNMSLVLVRLWEKTMIKENYRISPSISSNTNCQKIENYCWVGQGGNNIKYNQTLNILISVLMLFELKTTFSTKNYNNT